MKVKLFVGGYFDNSVKLEGKDTRDLSLVEVCEEVQNNYELYCWKYAQLEKAGMFHYFAEFLTLEKEFKEYNKEFLNKVKLNEILNLSFL